MLLYNKNDELFCAICLVIIKFNYLFVKKNFFFYYYYLYKTFLTAYISFNILFMLNAADRVIQSTVVDSTSTLVLYKIYKKIVYHLS